MQKNWIVYALAGVLVLALTGGGIQGCQASKVRRDLANARERVTELEGTVERTGDRVIELESISGKLKSDKKLLEEQYSNLRRYYTSIEVGNRELTESNTRSLGLVREGISIVRELREDN